MSHLVLVIACALALGLPYGADAACTPCDGPHTRTLAAGSTSPGDCVCDVGYHRSPNCTLAPTRVTSLSVSDDDALRC